MSTSLRLHPLVVAACKKPIDEASDKAAQNALAKAVRDILVRSGRFHGLSNEDAEDRAQEKVCLVCEHLKSGDIEAEREEAYVWKAGAFASMDAFRKKGRQDAGLKKLRSEHATGTTKGAIPEVASPPGTESDSLSAELVDFIRAEETKLPEAYRNVLAMRYVDGQSIADLAEKELAASPLNRKSSAPRTLKQARATVDTRLTRARRSLKRLFAAKMKKETH